MDPLATLKKRSEILPASNYRKAVTVLFQLGIDCQYDTSQWLPRTDRYAAKRNLQVYFDYPEKLHDCWMKEFLFITKKAFKHLCEVDSSYTEQQWYEHIYQVLDHGLINTNRMQQFFIAVVHVTPIETATTAVAA
jgi:hypothetical protein